MRSTLRDVVLLCGMVLLLPTWRGSDEGVLRAADTPTDASGAGAPRDPFAAFLSPRPGPLPESVAPPVPVPPPELLLETVVLKFLDAKSLRDVLAKMVTPYGMVTINEKNNSIVVCDTPDNLRKILAEVKKADRTPRQVMIEVILLDVELHNDTEIGVNWDLVSTNLGDIGYRQSLTSSRVAAVPPTDFTIGNATAYNSTGLGGDFSVIVGTVRQVLHLIEQRRNVKILASPRALVVSGQSASIRAVEEIPYQEVIDTATGGAAAMTSTEFKNVGVNLQVKATVTDGNNIFLTVTTEQNVTTALSAAGVPVVNTRHANTSLLLRDGQTVVIGGLRREEKMKEINQVPLLGDLPLVGLLFRSTSTTTKRAELVVLLAPHICGDEAVPEGVAAEADRLRTMSVLSAPGARDQTGRPADTESEPAW